jgi:hypothetical protein
MVDLRSVEDNTSWAQGAVRSDAINPELKQSLK